MADVQQRPWFFVVVVLAAWAVLAALTGTTAFRHLEYLEYDALSVLTASGIPDERFVIVGIDEPSFAELDLQWPWPRSLHGQLLEKLKVAGAAVVVFDVLFAEPSEPEEDRLFAEAIMETGQVVLAADLVLQETPHFSQLIRVEPHHLFREAGAVSGIAAVSLDTDQVVRRIPSDQDALWRKVVDSYGAVSGTVAPGPSGEMIRYLSPDRSFDYVSYYQALDPESFLPPGIFDGRIVFVGLNVKSSPETGLTLGEMFATPHFAFTGWPVPGVELQANIVGNALVGDGIRELPRTFIFFVLFLSAVLAAVTMRRWRPARSFLWAFGLITLLLVATVSLFGAAGLWLPVSGSISVVVVIYVARGGTAFLHERRRKRQIRQAFGYYVSRQVVEEVIANPEKLVLGGVRRDLTIMFTDLAGFTSLSEKMPPEQVAQLLNRYLTAMSDIIMEHGGTVDKFIGDAVMAFWGAPLENPDQAAHAGRAALQMIQEMDRLREELESSGLPQVNMRMGLHSGPAVVGNMGSADRFDYTAVGDNVNLASRLEGVNKLYGTRVLISSATVEKLDDTLPLRYVDRVRVAGKEEPIDIYTFCDDEDLVRMSRRAVDAYRSGNWEQAGELWREALEHEPVDGIAKTYLDRIEQRDAVPPGPGWDGVATLEEKY